MIQNGSDIDLKKYEDLLSEAQKLKRPQVEKNVFSIGGRGHYENPISDILAFFIDPTEEHGFGELILKSLFDAAKEKAPLLELVEPPGREEYTDSGNRIDIIAVGGDWVLVIENKIRHNPINPFEEYEAYISKNHEKKRQIKVLLSIKDAKPPEGWIGITYKTFIEHIKKNIGSYLITASNNKWHVILREFLLNIENESGGIMSEERVAFVKTNYKNIQDLNDMLNEYIEHVKSEGKNLINNAKAASSNVASEVKQHNWGKDGVALRLNSKDWGNNTNITLLLRRDGSFRIQIYIYDVLDNDVAHFKKYIDQTKYTKDWTESGTIRCFGFFDKDNSEQQLIYDEVKDLAGRLNKYYGESRPSQPNTIST